MSILKFFIILIAIILSKISYAHQPEEGKVFGTLGGFLNHTQAIYTSEAPYSRFNPGFGLLAEGDISSHGGLEIGLFYFLKTYKREFGVNGLVVANVDKIDIPMGYRYWLSPQLSGAVAFSSSFSVGDSFVSYSNVVGDQSTSASNITDYGFDFSVQWEFWTNNVFSLLLDGRYSLSISSNLGEDANTYGILVGLKYLIQEKYDDSKEREEKPLDKTQ